MAVKMKDFNHTVGVLAKAYLNDTLEHGNCYACAVGNIIAEACGFTFTNGLLPGEKRWVGETPYWNYLFVTIKGEQSFSPVHLNRPQVMNQINATGYDYHELAQIEEAFETADPGNSKDEWNFNGLMAVVDVLAEIHGIDLKEAEEAKLLFQKA